MGGKHVKNNSSTLQNKRKRIPINPTKGDTHKSNINNFKESNKPFNSGLKGNQFEANKDEFLTKKQSRIRAKELTEARKKKRRKHYTLEQELSLLWEKMRRRNIAKEERSKLVTEALEKMKGKIPEIASSHVSSRVLQTCVKYCSPAERTLVFEELRPHFIALSSNTYAVHLVTKMLDNATKEQLSEFISSLHGHVATLLRHMVGSLVIEHAYNMGSATQKQVLLMELYSPELQLFKDLVSINENRLVDVITKLQLKRTSVLRHMNSVLQPIMEKGIVDHSITHKALMEYLSIAGQTSALEVIQQLSGPILVRLIHTKDGSRIGALCIKHGSAKERKKIIKGMKNLVDKTARDKYGNMVLACIFSVVDDTKLVSKVIINEFLPILKEVVFDQSARRPLLQLLHPYCHRYFTPEDLTTLNLSIPSLCNKIEGSETEIVGQESKKVAEVAPEDEGNEGSAQNVIVNEGGKKDPFTRRKELLIDSGL
ncbi:hypothetical protein Leryth_016973 [Lithospermum erythrorhizon]|nr:hypothetical protein Leryth_016973 [Lithospermum erythrorhizon]